MVLTVGNIASIRGGCGTLLGIGKRPSRKARCGMILGKGLGF